MPESWVTTTLLSWQSHSLYLHVGTSLAATCMLVPACHLLARTLVWHYLTNTLLFSLRKTIPWAKSEK